jgi:2-keto-4-pentenoate hydratase/2-oxohepta-3-ene-1,7-dioic acid hydratase in catechol pathway
MKIVRYSTKDGREEYGVLSGETVQRIDGTPYDAVKTTDRYYRLNEVKLLTPCVPSKIIALGVNYRSHGEEMGHRIPTEPLIFIKPSTSVIGPEDDIIYPESSERVDYEGELGVVIKTVASHVSLEEAPAYILGYTCVNDVTARDIQARDKQWTRSKSFDTFCPIGPCIETELDPDNTQLEALLNGEVRQHTNTSDLVFTVYELVNFISEVMTLLPGDVIATGTTSGIGPMQPGDTIEVRIENIGTLRNRLVKPGNVTPAKGI